MRFHKVNTESQPPKTNIPGNRNNNNPGHKKGNRETRRKTARNTKRKGPYHDRTQKGFSTPHKGWI